MDVEDRVNIHPAVDQICALLGIDSSYVGRMEIEPDKVEVVLFKGRDGRCEGPKYVDLETGQAAKERLSVKVLA